MEDGGSNSSYERIIRRVVEIKHIEDSGQFLLVLGFFIEYQGL